MVIAVCLIAGLWIIFNECVWQIGDVATRQLENIENSEIAAPGKAIVSALTLIWRVFPVAMILGVLGWAIYRAFKHEPYTEYPGGY